MIKTSRLKKFDRSWNYKPEQSVPMYHLSKRTVTDKQINEFCDWVLHWCQKKFGKVKGKPIPELEWEWNVAEYQKLNMLGEFDAGDNAIYLRIRGHRTIYNLAKSIIHEYVHYLQPTHGNWYERYHHKVGYWKNPYEVEAYHIAELYAVECTQSVVSWMGKKHRKRS